MQVIRFCFFVFVVLFLSECSKKKVPQKKETKLPAEKVVKIPSNELPKPAPKPVSESSTKPAVKPVPVGTYRYVGAPKREFRGAWVATIANVDWPSQKNLTSKKQQDEFISILNNHQKIGLNAVLVQVRAASDAFYARGSEPWSEWLTGQQGRLPEPYYDPMRFMIEESHVRNMEFHAWLNLNRGVHKGLRSISDNNITKQKPEWFIEYDGYKLYDFGIPEVRKYIIDVVVNIVKSYDVDGIHFDDYFYPYPVAGEVFKDQNSFRKYGAGFRTIEDWRRENINILVRDLSLAIKQEKKWVKFGISPFGVWRNQSDDSKGSPTYGGLNSFDNLFADTKKWVENNWVDYVAPQVYFSLENQKVPYETLVKWWNKNSGGRYLYVGHSTYRVDANTSDLGWRNPKQMGNQLRINRELGLKGSIFYNTSSLMKNNLGLSDTLKMFYRNTALQPTMPWIDNVAPNSPQNVAAQRIGQNEVSIKWEMPILADDQEEVHSFVIYRFSEFEGINLNDPSKIIKIIRNVGILSYNDKEAKSSEGYYYTVTALDRLNNESQPSSLFLLK
jgi:uncharacterized lipoprotein YddW (UPF0748 family)